MMSTATPESGERAGEWRPPTLKEHVVESSTTPRINETSPSPEAHPASPAPPIASPGRELAARALAAACTQERVGALLGVSRRTLTRRPDFDVLAALRDDGTLTLARAELANTETRGSTAEERATADAWLEEARREDGQLASENLLKPVIAAAEPEHGTNGGAPPRAAAKPGSNSHTVPSGAAPPRAATKPPPGRVSARAPSAPPQRDVSRETARRVNGRAAPRAIRPQPQPHESSSPRAGLALEQVDALTQQQQRILRRSVVIDCALKAEAPDPPTMREAIADLLADITVAARTMGTILQQVGAAAAR